MPGTRARCKRGIGRYRYRRCSGIAHRFQPAAPAVLLGGIIRGGHSGSPRPRGIHLHRGMWKPLLLNRTVGSIRAAYATAHTGKQFASGALRQPIRRCGMAIGGPSPPTAPGPICSGAALVPPAGVAEHPYRNTASVTLARLAIIASPAFNPSAVADNRMAPPVRPARTTTRARP